MSDPMTTAAHNLATTLAQNDAAQQLGLNVDENYMALVDDALDGVIAIAAAQVQDLGPEATREWLGWQFVRDADRSAGLLAAAVVRLAGAR